MAAVTICSDFEAPQNNVSHCFHCFPIYFPWVMGPDAMIFVFWMLSFKPTFSLSSFTLIKRLFSSSSFSAVRVVSSAYLLIGHQQFSSRTLPSQSHLQWEARFPNQQRPSFLSPPKFVGFTLSLWWKTLAFLLRLPPRQINPTQGNLLSLKPLGGQERLCFHVSHAPPSFRLERNQL